MCGISGIYSYQKTNSQVINLAEALSARLSHRGPDAAGSWGDNELPLALAHQRLSIIDLSPEGAQPMVSASGRYVMTYNGEVYNFPALMNELKQKGHSFRGRSDTEVMLAAIEEWGLNLALQKFNGMFAFALWDKKEKQLHLVRDRLGKKPLYIGWAGRDLVFASELKALRAHPDFGREIDRNVLRLYMRYSYVPAPHCIYKNVWTLPAGCRACLNLSSLDPGTDLSGLFEPYWHHSRILEERRAATRNGNDESVLEDFEELLSACVSDRMISDVPLGAFLSGGIDSSCVAALMQKTSSKPVKTYTIGFHEAGFNEAEHAKKIAAHLGTDHHELYLGAQDAQNVIPELPHIYDEPFADISAIPTCLVSKFARQEVTVALSGDGGDEMFGGYNRHIEGPKIYDQMKWLPLPLRRKLAGEIKKRGCEELDRLMPRIPQFGDKLHKAAQILPLESRAEIYKRLLSHWNEPEQLVLNVEDEPEIPLFSSDYRTRKKLSFAEEMMAGDALSYLPNDILVKVDRASMAVALEARAPLLDKRIYEFAWSLPEKYKIRNGKGKWLLRELLKKHVPAEFFERPKQGFNMPVGAWLRGDLRDWAEDLLDEKKMRQDGHLNPDLVSSVWKEHKNGQGNHQTKLWTALCFQAWLRQQ